MNLTLAQEELANDFGCEALLPVSEAIRDGVLVRSLAEICAAIFPNMDPQSARLVDPKSGASLVAVEMRAGQLYAVAGDLRCIPRGEAPPPVVHRVAFGTSEDMLRHASPNARVPECPARLSRAMSALEDHAIAGPLVRSLPRITPRLVSLDEISTAHDRELYKGFVERGECLDAAFTLPSDVYCSADDASSVSARTACALVVDAAHSVLSGEINSAFCLVRPPGHHCSCSQPNGFCLVNNVAVAAMVARQRFPGARIAVVDIDVHHGEGTQSIVEPFADMTYISLHRYDGGTFFPYKKREAAGDYTGIHRNIVNVACDTEAHTPQGLHKVISDQMMRDFLGEIVLPALSKFGPSIVFVSCGFDAAYQDPLGRMAVVNGYGSFIEELQDFTADRRIGLVVALEGGYNLEAIAANTVRVYLALNYGSRSPTASSEPATPPTWADVRRKQAHAAAGAKTTDSTTDSDVESPAPPATATTIPPDEVLLQLHKLWIADTLATTRHAHSSFA